MGDTTWARLRFHKNDKEAFAKILEDEFDEDEDEFDEEYNQTNEPCVYELQFDEVNYGGYDMVETMWNAKLTFWYEHGYGGNYGGAMMVGFFGDSAEVETDNQGRVLITVQRNSDDTAIVRQEFIDNATEFFKMESLIHKYFNDCRDPEFVAEVVKRKLKV